MSRVQTHTQRFTGQTLSFGYTYALLPYSLSLRRTFLTEQLV